MKNFKYLIASVAVLSAMLASCRQDNTNLLSYEDYDAFYYSEANSTYAGQFKGVWNALNSNYPIWDHETVDWDDVYDKYLPKFENLDKRIANGDIIPSSEIKDLYDSIIAPLQDGHFLLQFMNLQTGEFTYCRPSTQNNVPEGADKDSFEVIQKNVQYFIPDDQVYGVKKADTFYIDEPSFATEQVLKVLVPLQQRAIELKAKESLTREEIIEFDEIRRFVLKVEWLELGYIDPSTYLDSELEELLNKETQNESSEEDSVEETEEEAEEYKEYSYNTLVEEFEQYGMLPWDDDLDNVPDFFVYSAQLADNVMYLKFNHFSFTYFFLSLLQPHQKESVTKRTVTNELLNTYSLWFDGIQKLHKAGQLKGVVIDVRGNGGGYTSDFQYTLGALLPEGRYKVGKVRVKNGVGRLDYAPLTNEYATTMNIQHEVIDDAPIVVLANTRSISMAEETSIIAKQIPNAYVIGNQTWGGMNGVNSGHPYYSETYSSCVGNFNKTSFALYIPSAASFYDGYGLLENKGVTPDIEVDFDPNVYLSTKHDTQLDRALEFIKTGK